MNQLILGNSYDRIKELPDKCIDLVVTDPPYLFVEDGGGGCFGRKVKKYRAEVASVYKETGRTLSYTSAKKNQGIQPFCKGFDFTILNECCRVLKKINIYIWCSKEQVADLLNYFKAHKCNVDILTWHKTNPIPTCNNTYLPDTEYCVFAREKGVKIYGSYATKHKWYATQLNVADKKKYHHPTIKPLNIIENLVTNSSLPGETVLDPFMGSGTTGVACKHLGRDFVGMEIDENYFEIAKQRIEES